MVMKTIRTLGICVAVVLGLTAVVAYAGVKDEMLNPVVKINDNCSAIGVNVDNSTFLLTAAHCTAPGQEGFISEKLRNADNKVIRESHTIIDTVRIDTTKDLALMKVRDPSYKINTVKIAEKLVVEEGDNTWVVGYPLAATRTITEGLFNGLQTEKFQGPVETTKYRSSPNIDGGNSGGALFQNINGKYELIGVTSMKYNSNNFMGLFVTLNDIREFLRLDVGKVNSYQIDKR